ncbi:MAG: hypothetical protein ACJ72H_21645 [Candidatus Sulfotelmatobacter sp.]
MHWLRSSEGLRACCNRTEIEALAVLQLLSLSSEIGRDATLATCRLSRSMHGANRQKKQEDHAGSAHHDFFLLAGFVFERVFDPAFDLALVADFVRDLDFLLAAVSEVRRARPDFREVSGLAAARFFDRLRFGSSLPAAIFGTTPAPGICSTFAGVALRASRIGTTLPGLGRTPFLSARVTVAM